MTRDTGRDPVKAMQQAVVALALEVPQPVHADVKDRWNAVVDEIEVLRTALRVACHEGWADGDGAYDSYVRRAKENRGIPDQEGSDV